MTSATQSNSSGWNLSRATMPAAIRALESCGDLMQQRMRATKGSSPIHIEVASNDPDRLAFGMVQDRLRSREDVAHTVGFDVTRRYLGDTIDRVVGVGGDCCRKVLALFVAEGGEVFLKPTLGTENGDGLGSNPGGHCNL